MAILSREEYFAKLHDIVGEDVSDKAISFIEDMSDTYNALEKEKAGNGIDWEAKYKALDESWKKKYRHRFFSAENEYVPYEESKPEEKEIKEITIDDILVRKD